MGLLLFAMLGFAIDVQTGVPRVWSGIAIVSFAVGSVLLYDGLSLSWITLLVAIVGMALAMLAGMPAMVRTRFSTPTIGREWMVGEVGHGRRPGRPRRHRHGPRRAVAGAHQPGHADRRRRSRCGSCPSTASLLEVEPLEGGAKDHRDRH